MKKNSFIDFIKSALLVGLGIVFTSGMAFSSEYDQYLREYDKATSAYEDAYISGQFSLKDGNQEQESYDLLGQIDYERVFSSADRNIKFDVNGIGERHRSANIADDDTSYYNGNAALILDNYLKPVAHDLFWYGKGEIGVQKDMEDPYSKITMGIGYGRVVNVTPMAKSVRMIEALKERDLINGNPSMEQFNNVADIISRESEYRSKFGGEDYHQMWMEDIEKELGFDLNTRSVIKSYDVLTRERISTRKRGWLVRAGVGAVITDYDGDNGKPALEIAGEYHVPINYKTQFSDEAIVTAILDDGDDSYNFENLMSLTYELSDLIDWENAWWLNYLNQDEANDILTNTLSSTFRYYISNVLSVSVTGQLVNVEDDIDNNGNDDWDKSLFIGLTYRLK